MSLVETTQELVVGASVGPGPVQGIDTYTSGTSVDPTTTGPWDFELQDEMPTNPFLPIGASVFIENVEDQDSWIYGYILAYDDSVTPPIMRVRKQSTSVTVAGAVTDWYVTVIDGPPQALSLMSMIGLLITKSAADPTNDIVVAPGSVRDSTNKINLVLDTAVTKRLDALFVAGNGNGAVIQTANLAGTIASAGVNVTGTGTAFLTDFGLVPEISDFEDAYEAAFGFPYLNTPIIAAGAVVTGVTPTVDNTHLSTLANLGVGVGTSYKRGGVCTSAIIALSYIILLIRKDSDGSMDVCAVSATGTGQPDLPAGYTYWRAIGVVTVSTGTLTIGADAQPLLNLTTVDAKFVDIDNSNLVYAASADNVQEVIEIYDPAIVFLQAANTAFDSLRPSFPTAVYSATIQASAVAGSIASIAIANDTINWSTNHGLTTGQQVRFIGAVPAGITVGAIYYVNALSATAFAIYTTLSRAIGDTTRVDITANTAGATMVKYTASNEYTYGMHSIGWSLVAGVGGSTTMSFTANFSGALNPLSLIGELAARNLSSSAPATVVNWFQLIQSAFNTATVTFTDLVGNSGAAAVLPGTWVQQGTTAFQVSFKMWSF